MTLETKRYVIAGLGGLFLLSIVLVQWMETARKAEEAGIRPPHISVPASSRECVECHAEENPGIVAHWEGSTHAEKGVGCIECHRAAVEEADSYLHHGAQIATIVTPRDCARCHDHEAGEFAQSHHAAAGNILASLD
ncbi:MAG: multiheme c-type cytochrome, partial [Gemmatimonadota bacterium]|nr:multiheme c-type cytochrome [Gemmatimonadota bacterium]